MCEKCIPLGADHPPASIVAPVYPGSPSPSDHPQSLPGNIATYTKQQVGASIAEGFEKAYNECKANVERIAKNCRAKNRKFRDFEFDIENDWPRCLHSIDCECDPAEQPVDVQRITDIFTDPVFYSGTSRSAEVSQGFIRDDYLIAALSAMTSIDSLVKNLCVARDEAVGVYGFVFYRDSYWVPVIIDDLMFTRVKPYEQLTYEQKAIYHYDKQKYDETARRGAGTLAFARPVRHESADDSDSEYAAVNSKGSDSGSNTGLRKLDGETWIPLVEKAYAKLHGNYAVLIDGMMSDALEDMTGGISSAIRTKDILDPDAFWTDDLMKVNQDRLFGVSFSASSGGDFSIEGLNPSVNHSVVKAVEIRGKRFVLVRDPFGSLNWNGPWSDGSKEWTREWLDVLPQLGHSFGAHGQFVMEYKDFLRVWQKIQRTFVFDSSWIMSSQWLLFTQPFPCLKAISYGDISFTFTLPTASHSIIALSKYDTRYFKQIDGPSQWNFDFVIVKEGELEPFIESSYGFFGTRNVNVELDLEAGKYHVLVRIDTIPVRGAGYFSDGLGHWPRRQVARLLSERAKGQNIAANFSPHPDLIPLKIEEIIQSELVKGELIEIEEKAASAADGDGDGGQASVEEERKAESEDGGDSKAEGSSAASQPKQKIGPKAGNKKTKKVVRQGSRRKGKLPQISASRLAVPKASYPVGGSATSKSDASSVKSDGGDPGSDDSSESGKKDKTQVPFSAKPDEEVVDDDEGDDENWETDDTDSQQGSDWAGPDEGEGGIKPSTPPVIAQPLSGGPGIPVVAMNPASGMMGGQESLSLDTLEDDNSVVLGLKVYTKVGCVTTITGRLRV